ncbi:MAG: SDR family oxidoreductase [Sediminibacterium sp.]|jgi:short-subunit dehydrogenase|nr:SDR family oxidoreductase [Chitinophagaceae bacterium]MCA6447722.1 SDR family oxidoreductase [Chitinophagaceae bacterium]
MNHFHNKIVVITGGSDGIGKALVDAFLQQGAKVATCGRNYDKLYQLQSLYTGKPLLIHTADVSKEQDCVLFIEAVIKAFGTIDILINNAGISMRSLVSEVSLETIRKVMDINFWGTVYCTKLALPYILNNKGTVVGVSSIAGYRGLPGRSGYSASKFAVNGWLEALRTELLPTGTNVMWVCPGFTTSNIRNVALNKNGDSHGESPMDEANMMSAEECAAHIVTAIMKRKRTLVLTFTGKRTVLLNRFFPSIADKLVRNFFFKNGELVK